MVVLYEEDLQLLVGLAEEDRTWVEVVRQVDVVHQVEDEEASEEEAYQVAGVAVSLWEHLQVLHKFLYVLQMSKLQQS